MSTILYARSVLSPKSMLVWLLMMELPRSGVALPDDDSLLARLCMTTPRGLAKARAEITAAGLNDVSDDDFASESASEIKTHKTDKSVLKSERNRRYYEKKRLNSDGECLNQRLNSDGQSVPSCAPAHDTRMCAGAESDNQNKIILGLYTESESDNTYTVETPNQILGDFCEKSPCAKNDVSSSLAEPIPLEPEIIPPDLSDIRSAVSGMLAGAAVPMSETPPESATGGELNAENPSRSATPVPAGGASTSPAKPRRSPGISREIQSEFARFWDAYPRKVGGKPAALKAYAAARKVVGEATLLEAVKRYARSRAGEDPQYTCHPATWLNQGRWDDEIPSVPVGGDAGHSLMRPGKRASFDPVDDAFQAEMAEIAERERENHVH